MANNSERRPDMFTKEDGDVKRPLNSPLHPISTGRKTTGGTKGTETPRPKHEHPSTREDGDSVGGRASGDSLQQQRHAGDPLKRVGRQNAGYGIERSPRHFPKAGDKSGGVSSSSLERKEGSHGTAPYTPGRRLKSVNRGDETPDQSAAVPKFGEWDESNPNASDGFTHIFNKVREERHNGGGTTSGMPNVPSSPIRRRPGGSNDPKGCCCFPWGRK